MIYDIKNEWMVPVVNEVVLITDDNMPLIKLQCLEGPGGSEGCKLCYFSLNDTCDYERGINCSPFVCLAEQRPDNKDVYFKNIKI